MSQLDPLGPVTIGAREIYDQLLATDRKVDGIRGEVAQVAQAHGEIAKDMTDHEARIRNLERGRWPLPSLAALVSVVSVVLAVLAFMQKGT
ncbi:hypothetical protein [Nonomuraea cypriaca]|uniref:hypothetical protein n=1 Tax=Nonomuraea cypriaca TaxID=1187855 RepID=UPI001A9CB54F|nr:hypothetical protein [Nonomuraea cypriaca]